MRLRAQTLVSAGLADRQVALTSLAALLQVDAERALTPLLAALRQQQPSVRLPLCRLLSRRVSPAIATALAAVATV